MWMIKPGFKPVRSYKDAHTRWLKGEGFGKRHTKELKSLVESDPEDTRDHALDGPKRHMTLRLMCDYDKHTLYIRHNIASNPAIALRHYAFQYHHTDCVVWREDNALFVTSGGYNTAATNVFISRLTPANVHVLYSSGLKATNPYAYSTVYMSDPIATNRLYQLANSNVLILPTGEIYNPKASTKPWEGYTINRKAAREVLASTRYSEFVAWARVYIHMRRSEKPKGLVYALERLTGTEPLDSSQVRMCLEDQARWVSLVECVAYHPRNSHVFGWGAHMRHRRGEDRAYLGRLHASRLEAGIRLALYQDSPGVIQSRSEPFARSWSHAKSILKSAERWDV